MRVSDTADHRQFLPVAGRLVKMLLQIRPGVLKAPVVRWRAFLPQIQPVQRLVQLPDDRDVRRIIRFQEPGGVIRHLQVVVVRLGPPVESFQRDVHLKTEVLIAGKGRQKHLIRRARHRPVRQDQLPVVHVQPLHTPSVDERAELRVGRVPASFPSGLHLEHGALSVPALRNLRREGEPVILAMAAPEVPPLKRLPAGRVQLRRVLPAVRRVHDLDLFHRYTLRINQSAEIVNQFSDTFLDEMHGRGAPYTVSRCCFIPLFSRNPEKMNKKISAAPSPTNQTCSIYAALMLVETQCLSFC